MENQNTTAEQQIKAFESMIAKSVLNQVSSVSGKEINHILIKQAPDKGVSDVYFDDEKQANANIASVEQFEKTLKPCVDEESKKFGLKNFHGFELEVKREDGMFRLEVFGEDQVGEFVSFLIPAVSLMQYAQ